MNRIAIFGQYKTGTTIIFQTIRESLVPDVVHELFEPSGYVKPVKTNVDSVLAKVILGIDSGVYYDDFLTFEKVIYIVRDPRDWLVSGLLFVCQQEKRIWASSDHRRTMLDLFRSKEDAPARVSVYEILESIARFSDSTANEILRWMTRQQDWLANFESRRLFHVVRYEQFVAGDRGQLEGYLGVRMPEKAVVIPEARAHAARTRSYGNWRSWFTASDIDLFKPVFENYIVRHNYDPAWVIDRHPVIESRHCSEYVSRLMERRRRIEGCQ